MAKLEIIESLVVELLKIERVEHDVSLFEYGLDSILLVELIAKIEKKTGIRIGPSSALKEPTINSIAEILTVE